MNKSGIYLIRNVINNKKYVGSTCCMYGFKQRWGNHKSLLRKKRHQNKHLQGAWDKYGENFFEFTVLEECPEDMLIVREQAWIDFYHSDINSFGYNMRPADRRIGWFRGKKLSEEHRRKISLSLMGHVGGMRGKKHSEETKSKMSVVHKGRLHGPITEEHRRHLSESHKGFIPTLETRKKLSLAQLKRHGR